MDDPQSLLQIINILGFPLVAFIALQKGLLISPRELASAYRQLDDVRTRCDRVEATLEQERAYIRNELDRSSALLVKIIAGDITPTGAAAVMARDFDDDDDLPARKPVRSRGHGD